MPLWVNPSCTFVNNIAFIRFSLIQDTGQGVDIIIPPSILEKAQGLAIFTVLKAGFLFSGRAGSGLVVAR